MSVSADELRSFLSRPPPRPVPPTIRKAALKSMPLGAALFGLAFFAFGIPFMVIFFPWRLPHDLLLDVFARSTRDAVVNVCAETSMNDNGRDVLRYEFSFTPEDGRRRSGTCYAVNCFVDAGSRVTVEYLAALPAVARIKGCRLSPFGWGGGFVVLFPAIGLAIVVFTFRERRRIDALLSDGRFSSGRIESVEATNVTVNKELRYRVTVSFKDSSGQDRTSSYHAYGEAVALAEAKRAEGAVIGLLYDALDSSRILLVDELLGS